MTDYTSYQLKLPIDLSYAIDFSDPVFTFMEVFDHLDIQKYIVADSYSTGRPCYDPVKLLYGFTCDLLGGKQAFYVCADVYLALLKPVIERISRKCAVGLDVDYRYLEQLKKDTELSRKSCCLTVKRIACLGEHKDTCFQALKRILHI